RRRMRPRGSRTPLPQQPGRGPTRTGEASAARRPRRTTRRGSRGPTTWNRPRRPAGTGGKRPHSLVRTGGAGVARRRAGGRGRWAVWCGGAGGVLGLAQEAHEGLLGGGPPGRVLGQAVG